MSTKSKKLVVIDYNNQDNLLLAMQEKFAHEKSYRGMNSFAIDLEKVYFFYQEEIWFNRMVEVCDEAHISYEIKELSEIDIPLWML